MSFLIYDLSFLVIFTLFVIIFLYKRRKKLDREGILFLYRTKLGIKFIDYVGKRYKKIIDYLQYFSIAIGYVLMVTILYVFGYAVYIYIRFPQISKSISAPPIIPLIPYFPRIFGVQGLFPEFYFIYFIVAILIVAVVHEFSHGIFAKTKGLKIKSTGFAFIGPLIGAFVEPDEKNMKKKRKVDQLAILSSGVFANILVAAVFFLIMFWFFSSSYTASGVIFNDYASTVINSSQITKIAGNLDVVGLNLTKVYIGNVSYFIDEKDLEKERIFAYYDSPAINSGLGLTKIDTGLKGITTLRGIVTKINGIQVNNHEQLAEEMLKYKPGEKIKITAIVNGSEKDFEIILDRNPENNDLGFIGIGISNNIKRGFIGKLSGIMTSFKKPNVYYVPNKNPDLTNFINDFLWWIFIINLLVAIFNMLPAGIFDGGRFFFLTVLGITKSENIAKKASKLVAWILLFGLFLLIVVWAFSFI